jgi:hypothetical protein
MVLPGGKARVDLTADAPGYWAFHCHTLYHMHAGMMRVATVRPLDRRALFLRLAVLYPQYSQGGQNGFHSQDAAEGLDGCGGRLHRRRDRLLTAAPLPFSIGKRLYFLVERAGALT